MPNVVILGCGRSGTSIFGELFEVLPGYRYLFEATIDQLAGLDKSAGPIATKVPRHPDETRRQPGLPFVFDDLLSALPEPRIYWMVRHPLDAISSLRPGIAEDWSHNPRPHNWRELLSEPLVVRCAAHWANINGVGFDQVADIASVVRYEDMVREPGAIAQRVLSDLGFADHIADEWVLRVNDRPGTSEAARQDYWRTDDHSTHLERWRENLSPDDVSLVMPIIAETARKFGYDIS